MLIAEGVELIEGEKRLKGETFYRKHQISMSDYNHELQIREQKLTTSFDGKSREEDSDYKLDPKEDVYGQFMKFAR